MAMPKAEKVKGPTKPLADVNVVPQENGTNKIVVCVMPDPRALSGERESTSVIALDASLSIKQWFGTPGPFMSQPNPMEPVARKLGEILSNAVKKEEVRFFYWALGGGQDIEEMGTVKGADIPKTEFIGPRTKKWGKGTHMLPAIKAIVEPPPGAQAIAWVMGVIITDGIIEDEEACMAYCMELGRWLKGHNEEAQKEDDKVTIKLVLIGLGDTVDDAQLERFDDMFEGTELEDDIDLWSHGLVRDIKNEEDIVGVLFGELMSEEMIVAPSGKVVDPEGKVVAAFTDGLPGKFQFTLPRGCRSFTLQASGKEVVQDLSDVLKRLGQI
ncbi:MAG: hypothetical protein NTV86_00115 [Planctomycetota bacterium]|nr:hypothetical protein [Planctomycetota bacterium]